jgi:uncharacterized membrane protein
MSKNIINALPELVAEGILADETSEKIKAYYRHKALKQPQRINVVFGVIGSILVGLGIILIVAHNWDELSRPLKIIFSFGPLVIGQMLCGFVLFNKQGNTTWKESSAVFLFFAVGASIALVAQVYNIPGNLAGFLFTWMLLCVPLMYIMPSSITSLLYLVGITAYGVEDGYGYRSADSYHYWWLLLLAIPHYLMLIKNRPDSNFTFFHHWFLPVSLTVCLGTLSGTREEYMTLAYMSMFGAFYLLGVSNWFSFKRIISNGYLVIGSLGTMSILLALSFKGWFWDALAYEGGTLSMSELLAIIVPAILAVVLLFQAIRKRGEQPINPMGFIFVLFIGIFFIGLSAPAMGAILMNLLVLAAAIFTMQRGQSLNHLGILNYGLLIVALLVICRFFDSEISFVIRGLLFVAVGAGFFFANSRLLKKRKQHEQ